MAQFQPFEFTEETIQGFREKKEIPVHFYNKDGQILIYKKDNATESEIERLLRFVKQGIYFNIDDRDRLGLKHAKREIPDGLSDTKLISEQIARDLTAETSDLFIQLKQTSITAFQANRTAERMTSIFSDFENQPDAMVGLVNIIEMMKGINVGDDIERATKRTVVAMAMKTRGMKAATHRDAARLKEMVTILMTSALLCDIGYAKMNLPDTNSLSQEQMNYIHNHPMMSYMMLAHEPTIDPRVKRNILLHHHPLKSGIPGNSYPDIKWIISRLLALKEKYAGDRSKTAVLEDIGRQLTLLQTDTPYDEDANILSLASEFASLTSNVSWRKAFEPERAVTMIVNNSFFSYPDRIIREFLDYLAISLCDNKKIIKEGDFVILSVRLSSKSYFEVCQVTESSRYQSKPGVDRFATIYPEIEKSPKLHFKLFSKENLKPDPRYAHYELSIDDSRHIIYIVDPEHDEELHHKLNELTNNRKARSSAQPTPGPG